MLPPETIAAGLKHLRKADPVLSRLIERVGPFTLKLERDRFRMLVRSIISQQISVKAARAIRDRLEAFVAPDKITAEALACLSPEQLRPLGVSPQKAGYLLDLSSKVLSGEVRLRQLGRMPDDAAIGELVKIKGVGVWTAQMVLMFSVGRLDVLPHDDLGLRSAIRNLYTLDDLPDKARCLEIAGPWRPYATIASWYCWRSHELPKPDVPT